MLISYNNDELSERHLPIERTGAINKLALSPLADRANYLRLESVIHLSSLRLIRQSVSNSLPKTIRDRAVYSSYLRNAQNIVSTMPHSIKKNANCASSTIWSESKLALLASLLAERANWFRSKRAKRIARVIVPQLVALFFAKSSGSSLRASNHRSVAPKLPTVTPSFLGIIPKCYNTNV